jgi:predicted outer membrane repeat protein
MFRDLWLQLASLKVKKSSCRRPWRLAVECLEDRLTPSTYLVINSSDNLQPGSLRWAIGQANGDPGSTVEITPQVTGPINLNGELSILTDMTIENDSGAAVAIHQQASNSRVFHILGSTTQTVTLSGGGASASLIVSGGSVQRGKGGGILVDNLSATLNLNYVLVTGNTTAHGQGGGIYSMGSVTLNASIVSGNSADLGGGGIGVNMGTVTLNGGSSVDHNQAPHGTGGGIAVTEGSVFVNDGSHVDHNSASDVGGIVVGKAMTPTTTAVSVSGGSTVSFNSSSAGEHQNPRNLGGGGIAVVTDGDVSIDDSQVSDNHTVGMYSGGIVVGLGNVSVTNGSQIDRNRNNGPGGGIAANFLGTVTVDGGSEVNDNTGAAIGGGIVNFSGPGGGVTISGGSHVHHNILTNAETIGRAIATFLAAIYVKTSFDDFAVASGGPGGAAMIAGLVELDQTLRQVAPSIREAAHQIGHPLGTLVAGGGIGVLAAPVSVTEGSDVSGNYSGLNVLGNRHLIGLAGGIFQVLGTVTIDQGHVDDNRAPSGDGGGVWLRVRSLTISNDSTVNGNLAGKNGGGIWNRGIVTILSSTVSDNIARGKGGGLYYKSHRPSTIQNSTFDGNHAKFGGGIATQGNLTITQTTISNNVATRKGGGIFWDGGRLTLSDVAFTNNSPDNVFRG